MDKEKWGLVEAQEETNALVIFGSDNVEKLVGWLEDEVRSVVHDVSTDKGRKAIASMAYKVSQSKTALDTLGKELVSEWKAKSKAVDSERKIVRDRLDALRDEVRKPLTEHEEAEKIRIAAEALKKEVDESHAMAVVENDFFDKQRETERIKREEENERQKEMDERQKAMDEKQAELDAKQAIIDEKEAAQKQLERDAMVAKEAEERATNAAEFKAKEEKLAAEQREEELKELAESAKREAKETEERVKREAEAEKQREADEAEKREKNKKHKGAINNKAVDALIEGGMNKTNAKLAVTLIAKRLIPGVVISY